MFMKFFGKRRKTRSLDAVKTEESKTPKVRTHEENMVYMASLGVSPGKIMEYKESVEVIEKFEKKMNQEDSTTHN